jgi:hypothetical protein
MNKQETSEHSNFYPQKGGTLSSYQGVNGRIILDEIFGKYM